MTTTDELIAELTAYADRNTVDRRSESTREAIRLIRAAADALTTVKGGAPSGADLIATERLRQVTEEGYDAKHDLGHAPELISAAREYAALARFEAWNPGLVHPERMLPQHEWPWGGEYFKPTGDPVRELTKAGALIAAAIDALRPTPTEGATT